MGILRRARQRTESPRRWLTRGLVFLLQLRLLRTVLLIFAALGAWAGLNIENLRSLMQAEQERDRVALSVDDLQRQIDRMEVQQEALNTNLRAIERAAREQFKMTMPGETLVLIEREPERAQSIEPDSLTNLPPMP